MFPGPVLVTEEAVHLYVKHTSAYKHIKITHTFLTSGKSVLFVCGDKQCIHALSEQEVSVNVLITCDVLFMVISDLILADERTEVSYF